MHCCFTTFKTFNGGKKNGYLDTDDTFVRWSDFHDIWWLLKEPFVLAGNPRSEFTCCQCTLSQPLFLH